MVRLTVLLFLVGTVLFSCKEKGAESAENANAFGEPLDTTSVISYAQLLENMNGQDSVMATVEGKVANVCQVKGCWMNVGSESDTTNTEMFVQFKDYGFFMPKDLSGKTVIMQGKAYREVTSVDDLKHFAEDEGVSAEEIAKITEPKEELKFMASGVVIK